MKENEEKLVFIYTLSDPRNNSPRYIGKTKFEIRKRLWDHIYESRSGGNTHKCKWIRKLLKNNLKPKIEMLDIVLENEWKFWETYWVSQIKQWGFKLTNGTAGGDTFAWIIKTKEHVKKLYKSINQYSLDGEYIKTWKSIKDASINLNISRCNIVDCCRGRRKTTWGYIFKYEGEMVNLDEHISNKKRPVIQYSLKGEFIKEWQSMTEAVKILNINKNVVSDVCNGNYNTGCGFIWKYKGEKLNLEDHIDSREKSVLQYSLDNKFIKQWDSMSIASRFLNIDKSCISAVCLKNKLNKTAGGFKWKYANEISN